MKYPKDYLDEIKLRLKVSQVVAKSVSLKKRGKEFVGLSPFKNEKTPSFTVSDEKEFYHCFSTGEHGNIFDFVMKTRSMGFGEAVKSLAAEAGMQPYRFSNFDEKKEKKFQVYKNIYEDYSNFFHKELSINQEAKNYITKRGITNNIIQEFKIGYVPWKNVFYNELLKKYNEDEIASTGLYYKNDKTGKIIDRFNSRIIFPINNLSGSTIAFGGRIIKESKLAKYINSPETEFYKKGRMLFNLDKAKSNRMSTNEVIIVEGYMDVVSLHSSGIKNVISNSGTALTENQIELIWKFFSLPILCMDGDESGQNAALRIAEKLFPLINETNKIYFSIMPKGQDPDDFIKLNGKEKFIEFLKQKKIIQSYIWDLYAQRIDYSDPYVISKFEKDIKKLCNSIKDTTLRKYILEEYLEKIKTLTPNQKKSSYKYNARQKDFKILSETKKLFNQKNHYSRESLKEFSILFILIHYMEVTKKKIDILQKNIFSSKENEKLKNSILECLSDELDEKSIILKISNEFENLIKEINDNSSIKLNLDHNKTVAEVESLLDELLIDLSEVRKLKKIESLETNLIDNLDENSYSELIKLKNQLNRE